MDPIQAEIISGTARNENTARPFVYDCFMFFNELDILELRLNLLDCVVDRFVLVESDVTTHGEPKDLFFAKCKDRFAKFADKIIHVVYSPQIKDMAGKWKSAKFFFENKQRDAIMLALGECRPEDVVLISDVDEIPDPQKIQDCKNKPGIKVFQQQLTYYYLNCVCWTHPKWHGTRMGTYADLLEPCQNPEPHEAFACSAKGLPTYFRFCTGLVIASGGFHFSYCGGVTNVRIKKNSIPDGDDFRGDLPESELSDLMRKGRDLHGRDIFFRIVDIEHFPAYLPNAP
jgi:beta-1,4-mannosyl-glycoprotein beta-1,4-N-acetylglucosaminyltransferase